MDWNDLRKRNIAGKELVIAIAQDYETKDISMVAFQDEEAFKKTQETGEMWFYSTSRKCLWKKGEVSANVMLVKDVLVDCDADALVYMVELTGAACHEGYDSCFYRNLSGKVVGKKLFDPKDVY
jgi:phosphoribosyl-AMP cyclohydrolase